ncbi:MAG: hypothetical protein U0793_31145 [Gemmataceae bacterium]
MITAACLITCAMATAQPSDRAEWLLAPNLQPGLELVYSGTCTDESLAPHVSFQRRYRLELNVLVLSDKGKETSVALLTALSLRDGVKEGKAPRHDPGWSIRLDLARLDGQGALRAGKALLLTPNDGPPTVETGCFVQFPLVRVTKNQTWEVVEDGRPARSWLVLGTEAEGGVTCLKLLGQQQSDDWDRPRADQVAWRRRDIVWLNPALGVAHKVERTIERRDPARREPTQRTVIKYALEGRPFKYPGKLFEDRVNEIGHARKFADEAAPLLKQPALYKDQIELLQRRITLSLESSAPTPYRKAIQQLQTRLDLARKGELPPETPVDDPRVAPKTVSVGARAPDVVVSQLGSDKTTRLHSLLGKPVLIFFYNPATETSRDVLRFAHAVSSKHPGAVNFLALAVTKDVDFACKQRAELGLPFPIHDGLGFHATFGVDATPRLILLDAEGAVRATHSGWGFSSPREILGELERCLPR